MMKVKLKVEKSTKDEIDEKKKILLSSVWQEKETKNCECQRGEKNPLANQQACQIRQLKAACKKETNETKQKTDIEMKIKKSKVIFFL